MQRLFALSQGFRENASSSIVLTREPCLTLRRSTGGSVQSKEPLLAPLILISPPRVFRLEWVVGGSNHFCYSLNLSWKEADSVALGEARLEFHHSFIHSFTHHIFTELLLDSRQSLWNPFGSLLMLMLNTHCGEGSIKMSPDRPGEALGLRWQSKRVGRQYSVQECQWYLGNPQGSSGAWGKVNTMKLPGSVIIATGRAGLQAPLH